MVSNRTASWLAFQRRAPRSWPRGTVVAAALAAAAVAVVLLLQPALRLGATTFAGASPARRRLTPESLGKRAAHSLIDRVQLRAAVTDADLADLSDMAAADKDWKRQADEVSSTNYGGTDKLKLRDVKVTSQRDLNEFLKLPNPMRPSAKMQLVSVTLDDGTVIDRPTRKDLQKLKPTEIRPVTFKWMDRSAVQTGAPKDYDEIIQRLLNSSPSDLEEAVRANWNKFDQAFFFRITELKTETNDKRLREKLTSLEKFCVEILQAAQNSMGKRVPAHSADVRDILNSALEADGDTMLWPLTLDGFGRVAATITERAIRAQYEDGWFEDLVEIMERFGKKMEAKDAKVFLGLANLATQRLVSEWLRHDDLWEETKEGQFLYRLMNTTYDQWEQLLSLEMEPLDPRKITEELKIIAETRVVKLPMASKIQIYVSKYITAIIDFVKKKEDVVNAMGKPETQRLLNDPHIKNFIKTLQVNPAEGNQMLQEDQSLRDALPVLMEAGILKTQ